MEISKTISGFEEKKNYQVDYNKKDSEIKDKTRSNNERNQFFYVHTENNAPTNTNEKMEIIMKSNNNNHLYLKTEEAFINMPVETENNISGHVLSTEPNEKNYQYIKIPHIVKKKQREEINSSKDSKYLLTIEKHGKYNFATHFINTSTTYDKNSDLKNATFDEKLKAKPEGSKQKEKKLIAPSNMKKNARKL